MLIENQLPTLDQSIKLKELGVDQTSLFYWQKAKSPVHKESVMFGWTSNAVCSAFTVSELGSMLGVSYTSWQFKNQKSEDMIWIATRIAPNKKADFSISTYESFDRIGSTEAEARAKLLISCIEAKVPGFTIEEINRRLTQS